MGANLPKHGILFSSYVAMAWQQGRTPELAAPMRVLQQGMQRLGQGSPLPDIGSVRTAFGPNKPLYLQHYVPSFIRHPSLFLPEMLRTQSSQYGVSSATSSTLNISVGAVAVARWADFQ